jgi:hypothetical protein
MIINDRKVIVKQKIETFEGVQVHLYNFEKHLRVDRENDEILKDIKNNILPFDIEIIDEVEKKRDGEIVFSKTTTHQGNYIWSNLKPSTKRYLRENDKKFSIFEYSQYDRINNNFNCYNDREKRFLKLYDKLKETDEEEFNRLYENVVVVGGTLPLTISNKAYMSSRRAYKTVKALALANCDDLKYFCTFTYADIINQEKHVKANTERLEGEYSVIFNYIENDYDKKVQAFSTFMDNFKKKLKKQYKIDLKYITVPEEHASGDIHFHSLLSEFPQELLYENPLWLDYDFRKRKRFNGKGFINWKHGKSDVQPIQDKEKLSTYIAKYMLKNFKETSDQDYEKYLNKKRYYPSRNLKKSTKKYLFDDKEIDFYMAQVSANTYHDEYINPYNDSTIHKYILPIT